MRKTISLVPVDEAVLARTAHILGESSAAHQALLDAERRRQAGQDVVIVMAGKSLLVVNIHPGDTYDINKSHAMIDARSLAMHTLMSDRIEKDPALRAKAIETLDRWQAKPNSADPYFNRWRALLHGDLHDLLAMMRSPSQEATAMRQTSPFGEPDFISQKERLDFIKQYTLFPEKDSAL